MTKGTFAGTCCIVVLALCAIGGWAGIQRFDSAPGAKSAAPVAWPKGAGERPSDRPALVLFAHPGCVCTQATLEKLTELLNQAVVKPRVTVYFEDGSAAGSALWRQAGALAGARLVEDSAGAVAHRFGARTSGQIYVYDAQGSLRYEGGLTIARGHRGESLGDRLLLRALAPGSGVGHFPVFGCALFGERS